MTTKHIKVTVNGEAHEADVEPRLLLLADPLDQVQPQPDPPAGHRLRRPAVPGDRGGDHARRRAHGRWSGLDP